MAQALGRDFMPYSYDKGVTKNEYIDERTKHKCDGKLEDDAFMVLDIGDVLKKHRDWLRELPRVTPFYGLKFQAWFLSEQVKYYTFPGFYELIVKFLGKTVKCMPYTPLLSVLAALGCGFDCASLEEIKRVLNLGISPSRIVYSHTRKQKSYLSFAAMHNVDLMTFDDEAELLKIKEIFPKARLLLRLSIFDQTAQHAFGFKYGCHHKNVKGILEFGQEHELNIVGVHFHIGSGSQNPTMFERSIRFAKKVFDVGNRMGFTMNVLDIGGGFPGTPRCNTPFFLFASAVREAIEECFPMDSGVTIIAEPGRYYVESAATLVTNITGVKNGKKIRSTGGVANTVIRKLSEVYRRIGRNESISRFAEITGLPSLNKPLNYDYMYFVNDGLFTSFLRNLFGFPVLPPRSLKEVDDDEFEFESMVMGETCPEEDVIVDNCMLPKMEVGDWIVFEDMGAYTCMSTGFNGFTKKFFYYAVPQIAWSLIQPLLARCSEDMDKSNVLHHNHKNGEYILDTNTAIEVPAEMYSLEDR